MSKNGFIKLPCLRSISVNNYALFNRDWSHKVQKGLNLFLGANGFGKTTAANLIIYGIVGAWEELAVNTRGIEEIVDKLPDKYFSDREHEKQRNSIGDAKASVTIEFDIGSTKIRVRRSLDPLEILEFYIDSKKAKPRQASLEGDYKEKIQKLCLLDDINDLSFLLRKLIIREEEGNSLLWNSDDQSKVIHLLFNPPGFFKELKEIQKEVSKAASKVKRATDLKAPFKRKLIILKEEKESTIQRIAGKSNQAEIAKRYNELTNTVSNLEKSQDKLHEDIKYLNSVIRRLEEQYNGLSSDLDRIREETSQLEYKYFDSIYRDPRISLIYNKIDQRKSCIFCHNHVSDDVKNQIVKSVKHNHCPVCNNSLTNNSDTAPEIPEEVIKELESLRQQADHKEGQIRELDSAKSKTEADHVIKWEEQARFAKKLSSAKEDQNDLKLVIGQLEKDTEPTNQYDKAIRSYEDDIDKYDKTIKKQEKTFSDKKQELIEINLKLNERVTSLTSDLSNIFNEYSKNFFFKDLKLISKEGRKPKVESKVASTIFFPFMEGKDRNTEKSVSKSEGILLEYLFRMSIIKFYHSLTNIRPFLILESSEGSFDIVRTEQLANVLKQFGGNDFPFISITNLSKPDFVKSLIDKRKSSKGKIPDYKKRILDFIAFGIHDELLDKQKKLEKKKYEMKLKELGL